MHCIIPMIIIKKCKNCQIVLKQRFKIKFCSNRCQHEHQYKLFINRWQTGEIDGSIGISSKMISGRIKRYLIAKYKERCSMCGWNKRHKITGRVPLEVDHIDGNADNNMESNLRLLCPNCHALTPYFRNLNKGRRQNSI